jgi:hypothetical protein
VRRSLFHRAAVKREEEYSYIAVIVVGVKDKWKSGKTLEIPRLGALGRVVEKFCRSYASFPHGRRQKKF